ncbi:hypothetical protein [Paludibacterium paludis]|uniref:Uncharacterized protein n=1 Tax=Paludibacterium paludis TaxID=1225769 RepID=A0A918P260_9NEIS|nr:hypothetical protein [Paludibacterium paludis]GGY13793.1 hypothetical protein GCM10011289_16430 [Paludibacterium paludis]
MTGAATCRDVNSHLALAALSLRHPYFADGRPTGLYLEPDARSAALMTRFGLSLRADAAGFGVTAQTARLEGLWSERHDWPEGGLVFAVHSADPMSACYTDLDTLTRKGRFRAIVGTSLQPDGSPFESGRGTLAEVVLPLAPAGCPDLASWRSALPARWDLTLPVRATLWKYLLIGEWGTDLKIEDQEGSIAFGGACSEILPGGARAVAIRSLAPIPLQERPPYRFELRRRERVVVPRLPMAAPGALLRETVNGELCDVSEIFLNR